jgi:hypothetical protein
MKHRVLLFCLVFLALVPFVSSAAASEPRWELNPQEGTVVRATAHCLVMRARSQCVEVEKLNYYCLADDAKVTCNGRPCKLQELKVGQRVLVTASEENPPMASRIDAFDDLVCRAGPVQTRRSGH